MKQNLNKKILVDHIHFQMRGRRNGMVVEFTTTCAITIKVVSSNPVHGEVYSIQQYVIKFVSDFIRVLLFPPLKKLTATIYLKYC